MYLYFSVSRMQTLFLSCFVFIIFQLMICYSRGFGLFDFFFLKQKTAYEMRISDWSADVCSSDLEVLGLGQHESRGMRKGVVVNIETTVNSIQRALEEAELMADCKIRDVYTGIAGSHIRSFNSSGMVAVKDKEVTATDVARVIEQAKAVNIPTAHQVRPRPETRRGGHT